MSNMKPIPYVFIYFEETFRRISILFLDLFYLWIWSIPKCRFGLNYVDTWCSVFWQNDVASFLSPDSDAEPCHVIFWWRSTNFIQSQRAPAWAILRLTGINVISLCALHCFVNWPFSHSLNWKGLAVVCGCWWTQTCFIGHSSVVSSLCRLPSIIEPIGIHCIINSSESAWLSQKISRTAINKKSFFCTPFRHSLMSLHRSLTFYFWF